MKRSSLKKLPLAVTLSGLALRGFANDIVNENWLDGTRVDPVTYSEQGVDTDLDGNLESRWFGGSLTATPGHLTGAVPAAGSASWTTYFTDTFANSVNLANIGDTMRITWAFTLTTVGVQNNSLNFRLAVVQSPIAGRLAADGTPASQVYAGYGMFGNMGTTLGRANGDNFNLMEWATPGGANNILSTTAAYVKDAGDASTLTAAGYADGVLYTYVFNAERTAAGLQLDQWISGGGLNGTGGLTNSYLDLTPSSYTFDTFAVRPSTGNGTALTWDFTGFRVETSSVPEPSTFAFAGIAAFSLVCYRRMRS